MPLRRGTLALCLAGCGVIAAGAAVAGQPTLLGAYTSNIDAADVVLLGASSNACVAGARYHRSFQVIGVTNPVAPVLVAPLEQNDYSGDRVALSRDQTRAYMVGNAGGMKIIALDAPASPALRGTFGDAGTRARDVTVTADRRYGFVAEDAAGIQILDLANETAPVLIGELRSIIPRPEVAIGVALAADDAWLYVAAGDAGLLIVSVTNPAAATLVGQLPPPSGSGMFVGVKPSPDGRCVFVVGGNGSGDPALHVIAVTNPVAPAVLASYADPLRGGSFADVALSPDGNTAYLVGVNIGLQVVDVSLRTAVHYLAELREVIGDVAPQATGVTLSADARTAYVAQHGSGLRIVDVTGVTDLDGDGLPNWWELRYFGSVGGASPGPDADGDGFSNSQEFVAGSHPRDSNSVFRITAVSQATDARVGVASLAGRRYDLETLPDLADTNAWIPVAGSTNIAGTGGALWMQGGLTPDSPRFYRVRVQLAE